MSDKFRELIARAAARANEKITQIDRGEYRPTISIVSQGKPSPPLPKPDQK